MKDIKLEWYLTAALVFEEQHASNNMFAHAAINQIKVLPFIISLRQVPEAWCVLKPKVDAFHVYLSNTVFAMVLVDMHQEAGTSITFSGIFVFVLFLLSSSSIHEKISWLLWHYDIDK